MTEYAEQEELDLDGLYEEEPDEVEKTIGNGLQDSMEDDIAPDEED